MAPQLPSPVLVGMDILSVSGTVIDLKSRTLMAKLTIPVHLRPGTTGYVHVASTFMIPACSIAYVQGFTNFGPAQDTDVFITPKDHNGSHSGYWVAHGLACTEIHDGNTAVYISVTNLTDEDVKLYACQHIASLEVCALDVSTIAFVDEHCTVAAVADIPCTSLSFF